jgi:hypothetical protein
MAGVSAGRWDLTWDRGGGWSCRLIRRDQTGNPVGIGSPVRIELREFDSSSRTEPVLTVTGVVAEDGRSATLDVAPSQIEALPNERYWHRIIIGDPVRAGRPLVFLRGWVSIDDRPDGS